MEIISPSYSASLIGTNAGSIASATSSDSTSGSASFMQVFSQAIGDGGHVLDQRLKEEALFQVVSAEWLSALNGQMHFPPEQLAPEQLLQQLTEGLKLLEDLPNNAAMQGWMEQAEELFAVFMGGLSMESMMPIHINGSEENFSSPQISEGTDSADARLLQAQTALLKVSELVKLHPNHESVQQFVNRFNESISQSIASLTIADSKANEKLLVKADTDLEIPASAAKQEGSSFLWPTMSPSLHLKKQGSVQMNASEQQYALKFNQKPPSGLFIPNNELVKQNIASITPNSETAMVGGETADLEGTHPTQPMQVQDLVRFTQKLQPNSEATVINGQRFAEEMTRTIVQRFRTDSSNGFSEIRLSLTPESLGHVEVKLSLQNGVLTAHFAAQTGLGREALEGQLVQLRASLQNQGFEVNRLEVTQNSNPHSSLFQDQRGQSSQQFAGQNKHRFASYEMEDDALQGATDADLQYRLLLGNAINVTA